LRKIDRLPNHALTAARQSYQCFRSKDKNENGKPDMQVQGKVCVVTGAASGIGEAVARAYAQAGARGVVVADLKTSRDRLANVAGDIDGLAVTADVGLEDDIKALIARPRPNTDRSIFSFPTPAFRARDRRPPPTPIGTSAGACTS
jgi:Enoyl-(Acyl carrier protein) reductase